VSDAGGEGGLRTSEVTGDMITFCTGGAAVPPLAGETEVVGALPANVVVAEMVVERLWVGESERTVHPQTVHWGGRK